MSVNEETFPTISALGASLLSGESTAASVLEATLARMSLHRDLNIFITETPEVAAARATQSQSRLRRGKPRVLEGIPFAIKDNFCTSGTLTTAGSRLLSNFVPPYESRVSERLLGAGAVMVGKANLDEFAMGSSTEYSAYGVTLNPAAKRLRLRDLVAGGSSGGSAAAVAAGIVPFAIGSDTGGSVRQPASLCGVVGFKPTYGVCSRWGIIAYGSSLDQAGVIANNVEDVATVMSVIAGEDPRDATSRAGQEFDFCRAIRRHSGGGAPTVGFPTELLRLGDSGDVSRVWQAARALCEQMGARVVEISLPHVAAALPAYYIIALAEASSNLARYDGVRYGQREGEGEEVVAMFERTRSLGFGAEVKRRVMMGAFVLSAGYYDAYFRQAARVRKLVVDDFASALQQCDIIATPTTPSVAFGVGEHTQDPVSMYLEDLYTTPVNLAGLPAITIPLTVGERAMPLGLQLIGRAFGDEQLLGIAHAFSQTLAAMEPR